MNFRTTISITALFFCCLVGSLQAQNKTSPLRSARAIFIEAHSGFMNAQTFEREFMKLPEFDAWGLSLVRKKEAADLIVEVYRKKWTTRFTITVMTPDATEILASCEESSLGGEIEPKLAQCLVKILRKAKSNKYSDGE
jgi:hypothetical protein